MFPKPKLYSLTDDQYRRIMDASQPVPYMVFGGRGPTSPQENANRVWQEIAKEMGFNWDTVRPAGSDPLNFYAEPVEVEP